MSIPNPIRVVLADDHSIVRMGFIAALEQAPEIKIVGQAEDGTQAIEVYHTLVPDVLLLDIRMPGGIDGIDTLKRIRAQFPNARVIMLTTSEFDEDVLRSMEAGAAGFLSKNVTRGDLVNAIRCVTEGGTVLPEVLAKKLAEWSQRKPLSVREMEVLEFMRRGLTNRDIGIGLKISEHTAKAHVGSVLAKLGAADRAEAVSIGFERGLLQP